MAATKKVGMTLLYRNLAPTGPYQWLIDPADFGAPGGMRWLGAWSPSTIYEAGSVVTSNGTAYVATISNVETQPPNSPTWDVLPGGGGSGGGIDTVLSDVNVTGAITGTTLSLGWNGQLGVDRGGTGVGTFTAGVLVSPGGTGAISTVTGNPSYLPKWDVDTLVNSVLSESGSNITQEGEISTIQSQAIFSASPLATWRGDGQSDSGGTITTFGQIEIGKENATDGNNAGVLNIKTRTNGGSNSTRLSISSTGVVTLSQLTASKFIKTNGSKELISTDISASDIINGAALTRTDDTNVTLTLGGSASTALLAATSITAGWTGQLSIARGGSGQATANTALNAFLPSQATFSGKFLQTDGTNTSWASPSVTGAALTRVDDTNVTLTLGGTPTTALLQATSLTLGWSGTLAISRGGSGQSTANAALNAFLPSQGGNAGKVLSTNGTDTSWIAAGSVGTVTSVTIGVPAAGITQSGSPITTSGTITLALANDLAALEGLSGTGIAKRTGVDTWALQSTVAVGDGGTAIASYTTGDLLYAASSTVLAKRAIGAANSVLIVSGGLPDWTSVLGYASGGTGQTSWAQGDTLYAAAANTLAKLTVGGANSVMTSSGTVPQWTSVLTYASGGTGQSSWTKGDILYAAAANTLAKLAIGSTGKVLTVQASGVPDWQTAPSTGTVTSVAVSSTDLSVSGSPITSSGTITLNVNTAAITLAKMADLATQTFIGRNTAGTGVPEALSMATARTMLGVAALTTKGDIMGFTTVPVRLGIGTDGQVLTADSASSEGLKWATVSGTGTVTSVAVASTDLSVSGSPITGAGTITIDINTAAVSLAKMANLATQTFIGRNTAGTGVPEALSVSTVRTMLSINNVENTALSTWAGSTNLTTLGTIATGTWSATTIALNKGGTGQTTATAAFDALSPLTTKGDLLTRDASNNIRVAIGTDGFVLTADSTQAGGIKWASVAGSGTVTSVAMTVPSFLSVAGSPITGAGTLAVTLATQTANTVLSGPTSGGAATPAFRALVAADIPNLSASKITSGTLDPTLGGTGLSSVSLGDTLYGAGGNLWALLTGQTTATKKFLTQTGTGAVSAAPSWGTISASDIGTGAALTKVDGTNVTLTLGGSPTTALLAATSITVGWTGQLSIARGGTGQSGANAAFNALAPGQSTNSGKFLTTNGANTSWSTIGVTQGGTGQTSWTLGDTLYASATNTLSKLSAGGSGYLMAMSSGGIPEWISAAVPTHGGTGLFTYAQGDILYASATDTLTRLSIGTAGKVLTVGGGNVPVWSAPTGTTGTNGESYFAGSAASSYYTISSTASPGGLIDLSENGSHTDIPFQISLPAAGTYLVTANFYCENLTGTADTAYFAFYRTTAAKIVSNSVRVMRLGPSTAYVSAFSMTSLVTVVGAETCEVRAWSILGSNIVVVNYTTAAYPAYVNYVKISA